MCRRWRDAARATPALWARIHLDFDRAAFDDDDADGDADGDAARRLAMLAACLARSGAHPLSISLRALEGAPDRRALALLAAHSARWASLRVRARAGVLGPLCTAKGRLGRLHILHLVLTPESASEAAAAAAAASHATHLDTDSADTPSATTLTTLTTPTTPAISAIFSIFATAPALRHLAAPCAHWRRAPLGAELALPWGALTRLAVSQRSARALWAVLARCPALVEFEGRVPKGCAGDDGDDARGDGGGGGGGAGGHGDGDGQAAGFPRLTLPRLRSLSLTLPHAWTHALLATLTAPALESLHLIVGQARPASPSLSPVSSPTPATTSAAPTAAPAPGADSFLARSGLRALLAQSRCTLRRLQLDGAPDALAAPDLAGVLTALPALRALGLDVGASAVLAATAFMDPEGGEGGEGGGGGEGGDGRAPLVPALRDLHLVLDAACPWARFAGFLRARGGGLQTLSLALAVRDVPADVRALLGALQARGARVEATHGGAAVDWL